MDEEGGHITSGTVIGGLMLGIIIDFMQASFFIVGGMGVWGVSTAVDWVTDWVDWLTSWVAWIPGGGKIASWTIEAVEQLVDWSATAISAGTSFAFITLSAVLSLFAVLGVYMFGKLNDVPQVNNYLIRRLPAVFGLEIGASFLPSWTVLMWGALHTARKEQTDNEGYNEKEAVGRREARRAARYTEGAQETAYEM